MSCAETHHVPSDVELCACQSIPLVTQIAFARRELVMRQVAVPRWMLIEHLSEDLIRYHLDCLRAIVATLEGVLAAVELAEPPVVAPVLTTALPRQKRQRRRQAFNRRTVLA